VTPASRPSPARRTLFSAASRHTAREPLRCPWTGPRPRGCCRKSPPGPAETAPAVGVCPGRRWRHRCAPCAQTPVRSVVERYAAADAPLGRHVEAFSEEPTQAPDDCLPFRRRDREMLRHKGLAPKPRAETRIPLPEPKGVTPLDALPLLEDAGFGMRPRQAGFHKPAQGVHRVNYRRVLQMKEPCGRPRPGVGPDRTNGVLREFAQRRLSRLSPLGVVSQGVLPILSRPCQYLAS
jgi:hypothetical protein